MITSKYFKEEEFKKASPACSLQDMDQEFMNKLDKARELAGIPFIVNSAYRTVEHEKKMKRDGKSAHTQKCAVDIKSLNGSSHWKIINAALKAGFNRIGVNQTFIHLDSSKTLPQNVIFTY